MDRELTPDELDELLGAYALDAVDDDERAAVEAYLRTSPRARDEVASYREVAAYLHEETSPAPGGVWDRIAASLEEKPPPLRLDVARAAKQSRRLSPRVLAAAAVLVVVAAIGGVLVGRASDDGNGGGSLAAGFDRAQRTTDVRGVQLVSTSSGLTVRALVEPDGTGWLDAGALPALPPQRTYQLWAVRGGTAISLGVLGNDPSFATFRLDAPAQALAVTDEAAGGVVAPTNAPLVSGVL